MNKTLEQKLKARIAYFMANPNAKEIPEGHDLRFTDEENAVLLALQYGKISTREGQTLDWAKAGTEVRLNAFRYRELYMYVAEAPYEAIVCRRGNLVVVSEDLQEEIVRQMLEEPNPPELITDLSRQMKREAKRMIEQYMAVSA